MKLGVPVTVVMVLLVIAVTSKHPDVPVDMAVGVIAALQHQFHLGCVYLLVPYTGVSEDVYGLPLYRFLARRYVQFAVISYELYLDRRWSMSCTSRALLVLSEPTRKETATLLQFLSEHPQWGFTGVLMDAEMRVSPYGSPLWLLLSNANLIVSYFKDINIPFDCQFLALFGTGSVIEVYKTEEPHSTGQWHSRHTNTSFPLQRRLVGLWKGPLGLRWHIRSFYQRRADLMGARIRTMPMHSYPFTLATFRSRNVVAVDGFIGSVWKLLQERMNFTTMWVAPQRGITSKDIVRKLFQRSVDIGLFDSTHTFPIKRQLDFIDPLFLTSYRVYIRHPGHRERYWSSFATPFTPTLWFAYLLLMLGTALMLVLLRFWTQQYEAILPEEQHSFCLPIALFSVARAAFQQAHTRTPDWLSARLAFLACYISGYIFLAAYSARLFASLAETTRLPFNNLEELLASGRYKLGAKWSSDGYLILSTTHDPTLKAFFDQGSTQNTISKDMYPKTIKQGLQKVCEEHYAFMTQKDYALAFAKYLPCDIVALPMFSMPVAVGIMVIKSYPYIGLFNYNIRKLREGGLLAKLFNEARPSELPPVALEFPSISLQNTRAIFTILGLCYALAVIILIIEIIHKCAKLFKKVSNLGI